MSIPYKTFSNGDRMPGIGIGTFGSDSYSPAQVAEAVAGSIEVGYRHIDCASVYGNELEVGTAIRESNVPREDLWITSKVWNNMHDRVVESCERSLEQLGLEYLDLYLVHWPFPNHHAPGVDVGARDPHAVPYDHSRYMRTWEQMEQLKERGLASHIGTSNMTISKLRPVLRDASFPPEVEEMEMHPHFQQPELFDFVVANGMVPIGYSPIGSPSRPERDRTQEDTVDIEDPCITGPAQRLGVHPAVVCVLWQVQRGSVPIPFSVKRPQYEGMLKAVSELRLSPEEMDAIARADRGCRLIKGHVFLWESAQDWNDLWE